MFIFAFCKICELNNTEHEIVFVLTAVDSQGDITQALQTGSQLLQNTEIVKQTDVLLWKI